PALNQGNSALELFRALYRLSQATEKILGNQKQGLTRDWVLKYAAFRKDPSAAIFHELDKISGHLETLETLLPTLRQIDFSALEEIAASLKGVKGEKGDKGDNAPVPVKGRDYFTATEIKEITDRITEALIKRGIKGKRGDPGPEGKTPVAGIHFQLPKDGQDGRTPLKGVDYFTDEDKREFIKAILPTFLEQIPKTDFSVFAKEEDVKKLVGKKVQANDVEGLGQLLLQLRQDVARNYGGHGGTTIEQSFQNGTLTTTDNTTFTLKTPVLLSELSVVRGGARQSSLNGDFSYSQTGSKISSITLSSPLNSGETLNIWGKT
ncbi:hypothetical protein M1506_02090, partial [Patescibacteria group bacterium]|nr:hypothetical protein [Patescibacteria group bacterium]